MNNPSMLVQSLYGYWWSSQSYQILSFCRYNYITYIGDYVFTWYIFVDIIWFVLVYIYVYECISFCFVNNGFIYSLVFHYWNFSWLLYIHSFFFFDVISVWILFIVIYIFIFICMFIFIIHPCQSIIVI